MRGRERTGRCSSLARSGESTQAGACRKCEELPGVSGPYIRLVWTLDWAECSTCALVHIVLSTMSSLQFWKPGTAGPGSNLDRATETEDVVVPSAPSSSALSLQAARERLPIFKHSTSPLYSA